MTEEQITQAQDAESADAAPVAEPPPAPPDKHNLQLLLDVPLTLSAELGNCTLTVQQVLQLSRGKVVELEKLAGEPLDILLNGRLIAHGEAVVVNERFGVRIVDIATPAERLSRVRS